MRTEDEAKFQNAASRLVELWANEHGNGTLRRAVRAVWSGLAIALDTLQRAAEGRDATGSVGRETHLHGRAWATEEGAEAVGKSLHQVVYAEGLTVQDRVIVLTTRDVLDEDTLTGIGMDLTAAGAQLVVHLGPTESIASLDEDAMRASGWVRAS